ncbi:hypothetical protein [Sulfurimonas sp.]
MAINFKRLPRFAKNETKRENLIEYISSLDVSKKFDKKTKRERIGNTNEYFLFNNLYNSCSEIIRNENILADRNTKAKVHTLITTSGLSNDLAFIADNIDGVTESLRTKITAFGNESDFASLKEAATAWEDTSKEITSLVEQLRTIVETNLEKGYGSPRQLRSYESKKINDKKDDVKKLYFSDGKTTQEIAEKFGVRHGLVQLLVDELIDEHLIENADKIKAKLEENISRNDISKEFKTSRKKLAAFIAEKKLVEEKKPAEKKEEPKKAEKTTAKPAEKKEPKSAAKTKAATTTKTKAATTTKAKAAAKTTAA